MVICRRNSPDSALSSKVTEDGGTVATREPSDRSTCSGGSKVHDNDAPNSIMKANVAKVAWDAELVSEVQFAHMMIMPLTTPPREKMLQNTPRYWPFV